ncbi:uncharacterized protein MYCFIDRAFT_175138 [Pseudocercospora fijiensis CIRAD86]|uniref:Uncharacterized protein n=1 Tax=Pseudocercospora fijiensis (strain CIRAD86) TaxID=383855 RepID=M2ZXM2_PSEFD|nr:uncharacterized protein MYCFIDRAFT_175138 [Pseudocercospora fijiensis CIRAD86]EME83719.1 hypothetical protein MYCFIDRAFT_175138 [Pseudocercospora fijiensis CIRAD86]
MSTRRRWVSREVRRAHFEMWNGVVALLNGAVGIFGVCLGAARSTERASARSALVDLITVAIACLTKSKTEDKERLVVLITAIRVITVPSNTYHSESVPAIPYHKLISGYRMSALESEEDDRDDTAKTPRPRWNLEEVRIISLTISGDALTNAPVLGTLASSRNCCGLGNGNQHEHFELPNSTPRLRPEQALLRRILNSHLPSHHRLGIPILKVPLSHCQHNPILAATQSPHLFPVSSVLSKISTFAVQSPAARKTTGTMRTFSIPLLLLALFALAIPQMASAAGAQISPGSFCNFKNRFVYEAINKFCSKTNLVVGSAYSRNGVKSNNRLATVRINGDCKPAQWVPQSKSRSMCYCKSQFYELCGRGNEFGANSGRYGRNACQVSQVRYVFCAWRLLLTRTSRSGGELIPTTMASRSAWQTVPVKN